MKAILVFGSADGPSRFFVPGTYTLLAVDALDFILEDEPPWAFYEALIHIHGEGWYLASREGTPCTGVPRVWGPLRRVTPLEAIDWLGYRPHCGEIPLDLAEAACSCDSGAPDPTAMFQHGDPEANALRTALQGTRVPGPQQTPAATARPRHEPSPQPESPPARANGQLPSKRPTIHLGTVKRLSAVLTDDGLKVGAIARRAGLKSRSYVNMHLRWMADNGVAEQDDQKSYRRPHNRN